MMWAYSLQEGHQDNTNPGKLLPVLSEVCGIPFTTLPNLVHLTETYK